MTDVQKGLLDLLKEVDDICRRYGIEYYLGGGTFIGAVRHGGFLPWDDDADLHMSRENAYKFVEAVKKENRKDRLLYTAEGDGRHTLAHWRYEDITTTGLMRHLVGTTDPKGQFVDIMVNYPLPADERKKKQCFNYFWLFCELLNSNFTGMPMRSRAFFHKYYALLALKKIVGREIILKYLARKMFNYPEDENTTEWLIRSPFLRLPTYPSVSEPKELWGKPRYIPFEDMMLPVAEHAEKLLRYTYGVLWFEVPEYAERDSHVFVSDMDIPYSVYVKDYESRFDSIAFYKKQVEKKEYWFHLLETRNIVNPRIRSMQGICTSLELQNSIEQRGINLIELVEQGHETELAEIFKPYFDKQNGDLFKYWGLYLDMPDEYLYAALYFQCFNGNYGVARKVLGMRRTKVDRALTPGLQRLCNICDATDELLTALYGDLDMGRAQELVDEWLPKEPTALYFQRADMQLRLMAQQDENPSELLRLCDGYMQQYPDDGELLKYKGDLLLRTGNVLQGEACYREALCTLKNGFCMKDIREYFKKNSLEAAV